VVAYPTRAGDAGGLPLSLGQVLLGVLGLGVLALAAVGLRRLGGGYDEPPPPAQVTGQ